MDNESLPSGKPLTALDKARRVSDALAEAARRARYSTRSRRQKMGSLRDSPVEVLFSYFLKISFIMIIFIPSLISVIYYGLIASDQYRVEFKFTVAGADVPLSDTLGTLSGIPAIAIIQDTQIIVNHLQTRAAVESLENKLDLRAKFSANDIDWWSRFNSGKSIEDFVRYWRSMVDAQIKMPGGVVEVRVRAFSPRDALDISRALAGLSENLVNELNDRMFKDMIDQAQAEVQRASERLRKARIELQMARNKTGILDATSASQGLDQLISETKSSLLRLENEYATQLRSVSPQAPQMQALSARINGLKNQIADMESKIASNSSTEKTDTFSSLMTRFSELELERKIAENLYSSAFSALEKARLLADSKRMYLNIFVKPSLPQEAEYPRRLLFIFLTIMSGSILWALLRTTIVAIRNHMG